MSLDFTHIVFTCKKCGAKTIARLGEPVRQCPQCTQFFESEPLKMDYQLELAKIIKEVNSLPFADIELFKNPKIISE